VHSRPAHWWLAAGRAASARLCGVALLVSLLASTIGCAARGFVRPVGPLTPLADADAVWAAATARCRAVRSYRAEIRLSGTLGPQRVRATLGLALGGQEQIGLAAFALGTTIFQLGGDTKEAVLWLREDNRVVRAPAGELVEALIGVRIDPPRLLAIVSGCLTAQGGASGAARVGELLRVTAGDAVVYLTATEQGWQPRAGEFDQMLIDYRRIEAGVPRELAIRSDPGRQPAVSLVLRVQDDLQINPALEVQQSFRVAVPPEAVPATIDQLRAAGPLGRLDDSR
jgi:hypothetical protein